MDTLVLLTLTGLGLSALYFLLASGLALIFGLMDVLNFAHGAFLTVAVYAAWRTTATVGGMTGLLLALVVGTLVGLALALVVEFVLIRRLYGRPREQILVTVGLSLAVPALMQTAWGAEARTFPVPDALAGTVGVLGARVPVNRFVLIVAAVAVLIAVQLFLNRTRYGLIVRAGVEDRAMVRALGIDVSRAFALVFALGGALAGLAGVLGGVYFGSISPHGGTSYLIFAFVVVIIGGLNSLTGVALASLVVGLVQQYANYYAGGYGDLAVVALLAVVVLGRPAGGTPPVERLRRLLGARREPSDGPGTGTDSPEAVTASSRPGGGAHPEGTA